MRVREISLDTPPSEREAIQLAVRQAQDKLAQAQADVSAALAALNSARGDTAAAVRKAREDQDQALRDLRVARAELRRAERGLPTARRQFRLATERVRVLSMPSPDTATLNEITASARLEAGRAQAEADRLAAKVGVQMPADELIFLPSLPVLIDTISARRGSTVSGPVMTVTSSQLAVDSSLSVSDAKLVRVGDPVKIEEQELGITVKGRVSQVASTPGTNRVDPSRFYLAVVPDESVRALLGASVKLTISVKSTNGEVLAVPPSALSVGGDGSSRVQVRRGGRTVIVEVVPGLAAEGLVEVRPAPGQRLEPGDQVVVGASRGAQGP
jgi:hypothetical protein